MLPEKINMLKISFVVLLFLHLLILMQTRFTAWPEMLSYPYLLNNGFNLYQDIAMPYQPLLPEILAQIYNLFGYNILSLQIVTWVIVLFSDLLIFLISIKILGKKLKALLPVIFYVALQPVLDGNMLWFDLATTPLILLGVTSYLYLGNKVKYIYLGLFLSLAFFIKQQIGVAILLVGIYFLLRNIKNLSYFVIGLLTPALIVSIYIQVKGIWSDYFFWTFIVPTTWYPKFPGYVHLPSTKELVLVTLIFGPIFLVTILKIKKWSNEFLVLILLFIGAFITSFPRSEFFRMQPALALATILLPFILTKARSLWFFLPVVAAILISAKSVFMPMDLHPRFYSQEDLKMAEFIKSKSSSQKIFLLGIDSSQYVLTSKLPPKPWVDNYVWYMEIPGIQEKVISGLINDSPDKIFRKQPKAGQWYELGVYQPKKVIEYVDKNYDLSEVRYEDIEVWDRKR